MLCGYARTSTTDQTAGLEGQERDIRAAGAERMFTEQVSIIAQRPGLKECLGLLRDDDALMVTKSDRLARTRRLALPEREAKANGRTEESSATATDGAFVHERRPSAAIDARSFARPPARSRQQSARHIRNLAP